MTATMRRVVQRRYAPPAEAVDIDEVPAPAPGPGEVLVTLEAAPVNPAELLMLEGKYGYGPSVPALPRAAGIEGVGRVVTGTAHCPAGALVALLGGGVWSELIVLPEDGLVRLPDHVPAEQLALGILNAQTALLLLGDYPAVGPGDWIVQNAGNSAVARTLDAVASRRGIRMINVVRTETAAVDVRAGTSSPVLLDGPDLPGRVAALAGGDRVPLAVDAVGGDATGRLARCLSAGGTVVSYGLQSGRPCELDPALAIFHSVTLTGFWVPRSFASRSPDQARAVLADALSLIAMQAFTIPVEAAYPIAEVRAALEHAARSGRRGKVLLTR
ncbi:MAG: zinc-dependent alcohol dehydrogenase family protein [Streptosporangiaceae bacterium]